MMQFIRNSFCTQDEDTTHMFSSDHWSTNTERRKYPWVPGLNRGHPGHVWGHIKVTKCQDNKYEHRMVWMQ